MCLPYEQTCDNRSPYRYPHCTVVGIHSGSEALACQQCTWKIEASQQQDGVGSLGNFGEEETATGAESEEAIVAVELHSQPRGIPTVSHRSGSPLALEGCRTERLNQQDKEGGEEEPDGECHEDGHCLLLVRVPGLGLVLVVLVPLLETLVVAEEATMKRFIC